MGTQVGAAVAVGAALGLYAIRAGWREARRWSKVADLARSALLMAAGVGFLFWSARGLLSITK